LSIPNNKNVKFKIDQYEKKLQLGAKPSGSNPYLILFTRLVVIFFIDLCSSFFNRFAKNWE